MRKKNVSSGLFRMFLLGAVFISGIFYSHIASGGQQKDILAVGEGIIKDNNVAEARNEAISHALKNAIEQYISQYLGSQGMTGNFSTLINDIIPYAGEDIENYYILTEDRKDDICSILVRVRVNESLMEQRLKDMGIVSIQASSIKILFLVSQKSPGNELSFWWSNPEVTPALTTTELKLYNIFEEQGMEPINRLSNIPFMTYSEDMTMPDISGADAMEWGRIFSADVIIKGKCGVEYDDIIAVDIEAIKVEDGESICRAAREEQMNPDEPEDDRFMDTIHSAIYNIAVQFVPQIIKSFETTVEETNQVFITLEDVNSFEEFRVFKKFLEEEIEGIKSVVQSRVKGRDMTVSVEFLGTRDELINELKGNKDLPVQADITDVDSGEIIIAIEHEMLDSVSNLNGLIQ